MSFPKIISMLHEAIGLDEAAIGTGAIRHAIQRRMQESSVANEADFLALLKNSPDELTALIEEVVVAETWFFRQHEAFRLMQSHLCGAWRQNHPGQVPRLLSVPSSSGEEAYSMAMTLLDAGFAENGFHVDAIDVSRQILDKAKRAVYGKGSFRGPHLDFRERHFSQDKSAYVLNAQAQRAVHFHCENILEHSKMQAFGAYDIIFCRNLLIYFGQKNRRRTAELLASMLKEGGLLFVGHAETGLLWKDLFTAVPHPMAFAYRKIDSHALALQAASAKAEPPHRTARRSVVFPMPRREGKKPVHPALVKPTPPISVTKTPDIDSEQRPNLRDVSELADQGRLEEARQQCEAYLHEQGASAQAWFLLGLINDTQDHKEQAKTCFRKALYLEPDHYEALVHFALLLDELGDQQAAQHLRSRMQRVNSLHTTQAGKA